MNLTEASSESHLSDSQSQLLKIEGFFLVTFFLLLVLLPTRFLRRRHNSGLLKFLDFGANTGIFLLIPFIFGLMLNTDFKHELVPVWATFLVLVYASVPDAIDFSHGLSFGVASANFLLYFLYLSLMLYKVKSSSFGTPLQILFYASLFKILEKVSAPMMSTSTTSIAGAKYLSHYISNCLLERPNDDGHVSDLCSNTSSLTFDGDPLLQCKYLVDPMGIRFGKGEIVDMGTTIGNIWSCEDGSLLSSARGLEVKSTCLSFSLFWMLLHKCKGVPSYENPQQAEAWNFVRNGLLGFKSPLKLIEVELAFLGDVFFRKYCLVYYGLGFWFVLLQKLLFVGSFSWIVVIMFESYRPIDRNLTIRFHGHDMDVIVTGIAIITIAMLELGQLIVFCNSRWGKVSLICIYIKRESWKKKSIGEWFIKVAAQLLCPVRYHLNKPLQRKLGQYSIIHSCTSKQSPILTFSLQIFRLFSGTNYGRPGRKESKAKTMSDEIEKVLIQSLKDRGPQLTNGIGSLEASNLPRQTELKLILACRHSPKLDTHAQVILVWHIATSVCKINPQLPYATRQCSYFRVATTLSKYCAYLVAFAPGLLPGQAAITDYTCTYAIDEAYNRLKDCGSSNRYEKLMEIANEDRSEAGQNNMGSILQQGADLGKVLEMEITDECERWKVLADFWAEMILYLAPSMNNQWAHVGRLMDGGGEFITLLWALLFHAGIVDRDSLDRRASDATTDTISASHSVHSADGRIAGN